MFSDYLYSLHQTPENPNFDDRFREELDRHIQTNKQLYTPSADINREISVNSPKLDSFNKQEIIQFLKTWKSRSEPGEDEITYSLLKNAPELLFEILGSISQNVFR